mmetsp:Transcript_29750/g.41084  ORF Transcript_29750/g.41084 Transcript_29750/m.41084 type:complete len:660 (-) Transcript_29750:253-2232(-)|eukprot:CAMPEP_0196574644 /NCGR_PEP_ID=MMETSP1081-20130531/4318_1 /TAXON_ID=36882 /ORGANISM="Pyramimonas amylifera, Strain CCMP720" /LENGTH=659 /DNA_ID=CAMNT_0041892735 /DNA_START=553 /DNA_END=2532 /DNA_ORIENTATION=+
MYYNFNPNTKDSAGKPVGGAPVGSMLGSSQGLEHGSARGFGGVFSGSQNQPAINNSSAFAFSGSHGGSMPGIQYNLQNMPTRSLGLPGMQQPSVAQQQQQLQQQQAANQGRFTATNGISGNIQTGQQLARGMQGQGPIGRGGVAGPGTMGTMNGLSSSAAAAAAAAAAVARGGVGTGVGTGPGGHLGMAPNRTLTPLERAAAMAGIQRAPNTNSMQGIAGNTMAGVPSMAHYGGVGSQGDETEASVLDLSEFPSLGGRANGPPGSSTAGGGVQGAGGINPADGLPLGDPYGTVAMQKVNQPHSEFSIQNEDFPALPGVKAGEGGHRHDMGEQHDVGIASVAQYQGTGHMGGVIGTGAAGAMHGSQQGLMGMIGGVLRQSQAAHYEQQILLAAQQQQQQQHLSQLGVGVATSTRGSAVGSGGGVGGTSGATGGVGGPALPKGAPPNMAGAATNVPTSSSKTQLQQQQGQPPDRFGLLGLLSVVRMSDPDLSTLTLGTDLTTLGLNLNSPDNLYKTFGSPWADSAVRAEPEFSLPSCYVQQAPRLQPEYFSKFQEETLFYVFYSMPGDEAQLFAANELANRGWAFHKELKMWISQVPGTEPAVKTNQYERGGSWFIFDSNSWERVRKDNFLLHYDQLEVRVQLPNHNQQHDQPQHHSQQQR